MDFSLSFFSSNAASSEKNKYGFLRECSRYADANGFRAIWTPERHFHAFGGIFPNASLMGVLLASETKKVRIRAGSIVPALHHPIRIAEEWSVVDNLSDGRVDLSFAVGWNPNDFLLAPSNHAEREQITFDRIEEVRRLWRGETFSGQNGQNESTSVRIFPTPIQNEFPVWLTCSGSPERFKDAGRLGFNVLTALISLQIDQLAERIAVYREARKAHGYTPREGTVTLMLHTYVGSSLSEVREIVREPLIDYLRSSVELWRQKDSRLQKLRERSDALQFAFERYVRTSGLFGTVEMCVEKVDELRRVGVDEIACLIDYGVEPGLMLNSLADLNDVRKFASTHSASSQTT